MSDLQEPERRLQILCLQQIIYEKCIIVNMQISYDIEYAQGDAHMYQRIRDLREDHDLTQTEMAAYLSISQATYSRYESGTLDIPTDVLLRLVELYHTSVDYLLGRTNTKAPYEDH